VRFLVDRCAGHTLAEWLRAEGHDVLECAELGPDPGDHALLERAVVENRVLVTIDMDFGHLVFAQGMPSRGLIRLPDVPPVDRIELMKQVLLTHGEELQSGAIVTVRGARIRVSRPSG